MTVARVGDRLAHLLVGNAQDPSGLGLLPRVRPVPAIQGREGMLDELLREAEDDEEDEE